MTVTPVSRVYYSSKPASLHGARTSRKHWTRVGARACVCVVAVKQETSYSAVLVNAPEIVVVVQQSAGSELMRVSTSDLHVVSTISSPHPPTPTYLTPRFSRRILPVEY